MVQTESHLPVTKYIFLNLSQFIICFIFFFLQNIISVKLKHIKYACVIDVVFTKNDIRNIVLRAVQYYLIHVQLIILLLY